MRKVFYVCLFLLVLMVSGCGNRTVSEYYMREDVDFGYIQRIAVLPFQNNSEDKYAAERARDVTITQVLALGMFDTVEKTLVDNVLYEEALDPGVPLDPLTMKRIGQRLEVQALLLGTVDLAGVSRIGRAAYPEMALTLRLVEAESGLILWQASGNLSGESTAKRLFGVKPDDTYQVTMELVRDLLHSGPAAN